jgi:outer membrane protein OmpA-like peptidoglycan-associated protein
MPLFALLLLGAILTGCASPRPRESITVLDAAPGESLTVTTSTGTTTLTTPTTATVRPDGTVTQGTQRTEAMQAEHGRVLAGLPEPPALFRVYFATGRATLDAEAGAILTAVLADVARRQVVSVDIVGHTDRVGTDADNAALSLRRAEAVREVLQVHHLPITFHRVTGRGEHDPLVATPDNTPEAHNRRVDVTVR